ncbi:hypothetical protein RhiirA5_432789 [Rhizophagus irregularis]|uniref:Uncharacterized protein n=1 Tax=Rhizophagus irregularis TaxID=588596 RepID=A0A2N0NSU3_9GLOM|nr:hypothetical protein RhiirA5_432789 [Rhizophagus irregularis]
MKKKEKKEKSVNLQNQHFANLAIDGRIHCEASKCPNIIVHKDQTKVKQDGEGVEKSQQSRAENSSRKLSEREASSEKLVIQALDKSKDDSCLQKLSGKEGIANRKDKEKVCVSEGQSKASQAKDIEGDLSGSKSINDPSMYRVYVERGRTNEISSTSTKDEGAMTSLEGGLRETIAKEEA